MDTFVAGGTGVIGRRLTALLVQEGHDVTATTHREQNLRTLESLGARPMLMDGLDADSLSTAILDARPEVVINQMTALSGPATDYGSWLQETNALRSQATQVLMAAAREAGTRRVVAQSAAFMTDPAGRGPTDELSPLYLTAPSPLRDHVIANLAAEHAVLATDGVEGLVLRYGFFYGPGTALGIGGAWFEAINEGALPIVGEGRGCYPFIHVEDAARATVNAVTAGVPGIYNVVDDDPAAQRDWIDYAAQLLDAPGPRVVGAEEALSQLGVQAVYYGDQLLPASNDKARRVLGMSLTFPSWRDGFPSALVAARGQA